MTYEALEELGTAVDRCELANWNNTSPVHVKMDKKKTVMIVILLKKSHSKNQKKIFRSQKLCNARSALG